LVWQGCLCSWLTPRAGGRAQPVVRMIRPRP
jgi:hypothetical protein